MKINQCRSNTNFIKKTVNLKFGLSLSICFSLLFFAFMVSGQNLKPSKDIFRAEPSLAEGNVLKLNGINDYVQVFPDSRLNLQAPFTIESWIYMNDWAAGNSKQTGIISKSEHGAGGFEIALDLNSTKSIGMHVRCIGNINVIAAVSRTAMSAGWHFVTGAFDGRFLKFYVDGRLAAQADAGTNCTVDYPYNYEMRFGRSARNDSNGNNYFNGRIDEICLYNKVLKPKEVWARYNFGAGSTESTFPLNLIAGWHFDEASGTLANDFSGSGLFGTLINTPFYLPRTISPNAIMAVSSQNTSPSSATIRWVTGLPSNSVVEYGRTTSFGQRVTVDTSTLEHAVSLSGLLPNTEYHFRIISNLPDSLQITSGNYVFRTLDTPPTNNQFFVAPNGLPTNNGSFGSPWDLRTALSHPTAVRPGATIWMRGGRYYVPTTDGSFISNLSGTADQPITVKSYPDEWATVDGNLGVYPIKNRTILIINGRYTRFENFEVTNTDITNRKIGITGSNPPERRGNSIDDFGVGTKLINLIIHDTGQGIGAWMSGYDNEYYGNIIYHNGWDNPLRLAGHGVYTQNELGYKNFTDNIIFNQFGYNTQTGGSNAASVRNYTWQGNVFFNGSMAWQGPNIENLRVFENYTYKNSFKVGNEVNTTYLNAEVANNYFMSGVQLFEFSRGLIFRNNTVWNTDSTGKNLTISTNSSNPQAIYNINDNTYYQAFRSFPYWHFAIYGGVKNGDYAFNRTQGTQVSTYSYTRKSWQDDLTFDVNSTYIDGVPTENKVVVRPNAYDSKRAHIIIYNWRLDNMIFVYPGSVLQNGDLYELRNVQDYFGDVLSGVYNGESIGIPMNGRTRVLPIGYESVSEWYHNPLQPNTFPMFGAFVLIKKSASSQLKSDQ